MKEIYSNIEVKNTYGYITKQKRIALGLEKAHHIDAYCIAGNLGAARIGYYWYQRQMRKHNRQIHKLKFLKGGVRKLDGTKLSAGISHKKLELISERKTYLTELKR